MTPGTGTATGEPATAEAVFAPLDHPGLHLLAAHTLHTARRTGG